MSSRMSRRTDNVIGQPLVRHLRSGDDWAFRHFSVSQEE
jgi:hypothetical protein